jgi:mannitol/fructose-specific phosphotransferase system IIA component (Ntr-type)
MKLTDFLTSDSIDLDLQASSKDEVLQRLVSLLPISEKTWDTLVKMLKKRERLGSTGIGKGVAIPHGRSLLINRLMLAFARSKEGIDFDSVDGQPSHLFFLIMAPPLEVSNLYLPTLGKIAQISREEENREQLTSASTPEELIEILERLDRSTRT